MMLLFQRGLSVTPRHQMMKTCQEHLQKTLSCPVAASRLSEDIHAELQTWGGVKDGGHLTSPGCTQVHAKVFNHLLK